MSVDEDPALAVPADRLTKGGTLSVPSDCHQCAGRVGVVDRDDLQGDDRPLIEVTGIGDEHAVGRAWRLASGCCCRPPRRDADVWPGTWSPKVTDSRPM